MPELNGAAPQNLEAEQSVLGGILLENDAINVVSNVLRPDDFYKESHRKLYRAMLALDDLGDPIDVVIWRARQEKTLQIIRGAARSSSTWRQSRFVMPKWRKNGAPSQ